MVGLPRGAVTESELVQLGVMLDLVAHADGDPTPAQQEVVAAYRRAAL